MPTKIEWADETWNPVTGCTPISEGCHNCYAERMAKRLAGRCGYDADNPFKVTLHPDRLDQPLRWKKPRKIFVCSMGDLFHPEVPELFFFQVYEVMERCPQHTFLLLTKRPDYATWLLNKFTGRTWPLPNIWLGVTAENQARADERIPVLLQIPAAVRFVSIEPMLGPVSLARWLPWDMFRKGLPGWIPNPDYKQGIHWIIAGGETGPGARPMHPDWARSLKNQCQATEVPFFFKSWGDWAPPDDGVTPHKQCQTILWNDNTLSCQVGKKRAGRMLDGQEWQQFPEVILCNQ